MKIKKITALVLCFMMLLSLFSCSRKSDIGNTPDNRTDKEEKQESENKYNILVLGHDRAANLTDVMMIVSFDVKEGTMAIVQLPRDTYFEADDYYYHKINGLYNYFISESKEDDSDDPELEGCIRTAKYLSDNLDIKIHYSAVMDLDGFGDIVDAIGGVYMYLPYSMYYPDPAQNLLIDLQKGFQTLDGDAAEQFVRFRYGYITGDDGRQDAQKMFMTAFIENAKNNINLSNVDDVASAIFNSVKTDMKLTDIAKFGKAMLSMELSNITMMSFPGESTLCNGAWYFVMNRASAIELMQKYYNVYEDPVTEETFDKDRVFCNEDDPDMYETYVKPADECETVEHNAQDVSNDDIAIPMY